MKKVLVALCCVATLASCKKESVTIAKSDALVAHSWKTSKVEAVVNGIGVDATSTFVEDCDKDDTETFTADKKWTANHGTVKCDTNEAATETGTWALSENDSKLSVTSPDGTDVYTVNTLDANTMVLTKTVPVFGTLRMTYIKN
jgi:Lipocalin-like domain